MSQYADMIRKMFGEGDAKRDEGLTTPEDVVRFDSIAYDTKDEVLNLLDVYRPKDAEGKLPVIISVHGGGWVYGNKEVYQFYCMSLAQRGFAVVNYSYRLAPEYKYPSSFEDSCNVAKFVMDNTEKYGFDTNNIFAVGDSAGAHMLSLLAAHNTNPDFKVPYALPDGFRFKAIALNCGVFEMKTETLGDTAMIMNEYLPNGITDEALDEISAAHHVTKDYPPTFLMSCPGDFLKDGQIIMVNALFAQKVPFVFRMYGSSENELAHVFHCNVRLPEATVCNDDECSFFREYLD